MINKNVFAGILALFLFGCTPLIPTRVLKHPQAYEFEFGIPLVWDGNYPVKVFQTELRLNENILGPYGYYYSLEKHDEKDSTYTLSVRLDKELYYPKYDGEVK